MHAYIHTCARAIEVGFEPEYIGIAPSLDELPTKSIALIDEAYFPYHSRGNMAAASNSMSQSLNLSRQPEQTRIFVTQESRQFDKNIRQEKLLLR
jgi:hypothetical protein